MGNIANNASYANNAHSAIDARSAVDAGNAGNAGSQIRCFDILVSITGILRDLALLKHSLGNRGYSKQKTELDNLSKRLDRTKSALFDYDYLSTRKKTDSNNKQIIAIMRILIKLYDKLDQIQMTVLDEDNTDSQLLGQVSMIIEKIDSILNELEEYTYLI